MFMLAETFFISRWAVCFWFWFSVGFRTNWLRLVIYAWNTKMEERFTRDCQVTFYKLYLFLLHFVSSTKAKRRAEKRSCMLCKHDCEHIWLCFTAEFVTVMYNRNYSVCSDRAAQSLGSMKEDVWCAAVSAPGSFNLHFCFVCNYDVNGVRATQNILWSRMSFMSLSSGF